MTPEEKARQTIDENLHQAGWVIQDYKQLNLGAARGVAIREVPLRSGTCDYLLVVDRQPVGVVEAKRTGTRLSGVAEQSGDYASNLPDFLRSTDPLPFLYESTGVETFYRDERDPEPRSRRVFTFHRPETLAELAKDARTLRARLAEMPATYPLGVNGMRACQVEAITNLEKSFAAAHPRALIQMATGAGKTYTACAFTYRLIKHAGAKRVLFLVDRANLGRQALAEFQQFVCPDTGRKFTELYNVQHLTSSQLDSCARVTICTIQRLYSILRGEELEEDIDEKSGFELAAADDRPRDVKYSDKIPIEAFDVIVTDECHRSIYNLWRQVLEYFDSFLVGLTATPSKQTIGFFNQNLVMEYNHERAVADGVNVGYEVYRIKTQVTGQGGKVEKGFYIDKRSKETRAIRWQRLDEDLTYAAQELDRSVVVPSQIRTVLQAYKDAIFTDLFPGRTLVPKTLIFCKDDSHAEDTVHLVREVFGKGNDFAKKITYKTYNPETKRYEKSETLIQEFRTSPQLRIAVTVDMIATGTDIKPLECLLFLRDIRSRTYFEQMKGRGTRVLTATDLQAVSGADARAKTHFYIIDAVGVCESDKTDSRPLERQRTVAFDKLLLGVALGKRDENTLTTLAGRLARLDRELNRQDAKTLSELAGGKTLTELSANLLKAVDPDEVEAASRRLSEQRAESRQVELAQFLNPLAPVEFQTGTLPHWRQEGVTYFVTFRLADSLPAEKLAQWHSERDTWLAQHGIDVAAASRRSADGKDQRRDAAATLTPEQEAEYHTRFSARIEQWLDQGSGACVLDLPACRTIVENALRHFDGERYALGEFVVAPNHVHVIVAPKPGHELSDILHSWKSFSAKEILKMEAASRRLTPQRSNSPSAAPDEYPVAPRRTVWQKESYDHIVRNAAAMARIEQYIRDHCVAAASRREELEQLRRDAAATLITAACAPFDLPALRDALAKAKQDAEQIIDTVTIDAVVSQGFDAAAKEKAANLLKSFRAYIEQHKPEITALQILYSRPYKQRLTEPMLKELEAKLREPFGNDPVNAIWRAYESAGRDGSPSRPSASAPIVVKKNPVARFADLIPLVRFALEQQPVLKPFADSVNERFNEWLMDKAKQVQSGSGVPPLGMKSDKQRRDAAATASFFTPEQLSWLNLIRNHIATTCSIELDDFESVPFNQQGGLGRAHQLFGESLPALLDELNTTLAA